MDYVRHRHTHDGVVVEVMEPKYSVLYTPQGILFKERGGEPYKIKPDEAAYFIRTERQRIEMERLIQEKRRAAA